MKLLRGDVMQISKSKSKPFFAFSIVSCLIKYLVSILWSFPFLRRFHVRYCPLLQLQSSCHCIVNHYVHIWLVPVGLESNMHVLSWTEMEKNPYFEIHLCLNTALTGSFVPPTPVRYTTPVTERVPLYSKSLF